MNSIYDYHDGNVDSQTKQEIKLVNEDQFELDLSAFVGNSHVDNFAALFPPNPMQFIRMRDYNKDTGKKDTEAFTQPGSTEIEQHINEEGFIGTLGYLPGWAEETHVVCVDVDVKDKLPEAFQRETQAIQAALSKRGVAFNLERSTNGGHHLSGCS
jgi:hypothetical protein